MSIGVQNFTPETFLQANPALKAAAVTQQLVAQGQQNYFNPQIQQQAVLKAQLQNQMMAPQVQLAPQFAQAKLAYAQAQPAYLGAQTQGILQGQIPLNQAQAANQYAQSNLTQAEVKYVPVTSWGKYYQGMGSALRYAPSNIVFKNLSNPAFQNAIANNPSARNAVAAMIQDVTTGNNPGFIGMPMPPGYSNNNGMPGIPGGSSSMGPTANSGGGISSPGLVSAQPQNNSQQAYVPQGAFGAQPSSSSPSINGMIPTAYGYISPGASTSLQGQLQNSLMKTNYTPAQIQQITYDNSLRNMMAQAAPTLNMAAQYTGAAGSAAATWNQLVASAGGPASPQYKALNNFVNIQAPMMANEIGRALGKHPTDQQEKTLSLISNPISWKKNFPMVMSQMNSLVDTIHSNTAAITQTTGQNLAQAQQGLTNPVTFGAPSPSAPPSSNVPQGTLQIPTFRNKLEFQQWVKNLPPPQREQLRAQLSGER